ncbi:hypothetical protein C8R43DRAFT_19559 [Mycena crocata]|nr:hypothetical protein C8R43DRAFT_19559 [Mycena crocata]
MLLRLARTHDHTADVFLCLPLSFLRVVRAEYRYGSQSLALCGDHAMSRVCGDDRPGPLPSTSSARGTSVECSTHSTLVHSLVRHSRLTVEHLLKLLQSVLIHQPANHPHHGADHIPYTAHPKMKKKN